MEGNSVLLFELEQLEPKNVFLDALLRDLNLDGGENIQVELNGKGSLEEERRGERDELQKARLDSRKDFTQYRDLDDEMKKMGILYV